MQTDVHEVHDLLSWRLLFQVLLVAALPAWALWRVRVVPMGFVSQAWRNALLLLAAVAVAVAGALAMGRQLAPLMRNNVHLRYMMNPLASIYSASAVAIRPMFKHSRKLIPVSGGAALGASYAAQARPPLFVLVVGETARADHFALNGYARDTTPELAARKVLSWRNVHSCGTNTLASVPCMFSPLGKAAFEARKDDYENLMDVLQAAGLAVFWLDNQLRPRSARIGLRHCRRRRQERALRRRRMPRRRHAPWPGCAPGRVAAGAPQQGRGAGHAPDGQPWPGLLQAVGARRQALPA
jgi:lipid A ethanolaminephosphotransferase